MRIGLLLSFTVALVLTGAAGAKTAAPAKPRKHQATTATATTTAATPAPATSAALPDGLVIVEDRPYVAPLAAKPTVKTADTTTTGWQAAAGSTARGTLSAWAAKAGWTVQWDAPYDFPVVAALSYGGPFESAVSSYFENYTDASRTNRPISVDLYRSNRIVHVYPKMKGPK